jgi:hypothetical protein
MKKLIYLFILCAFVSRAQNSTVPNGISYQGVARDASGTVLSNATIAVKFEIKDIPTNTTVYTETYAGGSGLTSNSIGIFTAIIGSQNPTSFQTIAWAGAPHKIDIYLDVNNGTSFTYIGSQAFQSVPYAFHSADGLLWKGRATSAPASAIKGSVYRDPIGGATYYLNNTGTWDTLAYTSGGSLPAATMNKTIYHNGTNWSVTNQFNIEAGYKLVIGKTFSDASAVVDIADSLHGMLIPRMSYAKRIGIASPADGLLVYQINENIPAVSPKGFYYYDVSGVTPGWRWIPPYNNFTSPWLRNSIAGNDHVFLANPSDYVNIGLPTGVAANEKFHVHDQIGDAYIQLSTSSNSNNVGLVFGESSNISKGVLTFDNTSSSLTYRLFGQRLFFVEGNSKGTHIGKMPFGVSSNCALSVYDSISSTTLKPIMRVINANGTLSDPSAIFLGSNPINGMNISYRGSPVSKLSFDGPGFSQSIHTFDINGKYSPGSDGAAGKSFIQGGPAPSDDISINAASAGNIVHMGYTQLGGNSLQVPAIQVLEFTGTMPNTASGSTTIGLGSYVTTPGQILSVQLFVMTSNRTVPPSFTMFPNYEYHYEITPGAPNILVWASNANSSFVLGQPFRALVTIKK